MACPLPLGGFENFTLEISLLGRGVRNFNFGREYFGGGGRWEGGSRNFELKIKIA